MMREIEDPGEIARLDDDDTPFETPPGAPARKARGRARPKKKRPSIVLFSVLAIVYALGAAAAGIIGHDLLLLTWLVAGPVIVMITRAFRSRVSQSRGPG